MRKVIAAAFVSLDGVMQAPGGPTEDPTGGFTQGGWTVTYWDEAMGRFMDEMFATPFDLLLGRKTYEIFAAHWPYAEEGDPVRVAFDACTKYVATRSDQDFTWMNTTPLRGDAPAQVATLKQGEGPVLLTQGSSELLQALLAHDLIDEFRLLTFPVVLGPGKKLFGEGAHPGGLKLVSTAVATTGVIMSVYERAGAIEIGSFQQAQPSAAELARQARMAREG